MLYLTTDILHSFQYFIDGIEKSPSGRATCVSCDDVIVHGEIRGYKTIHEKRYAKKIYHCSKCTVNILGVMKTTNRQMSKEVKTWIYKNKDKFMLKRL